MAWLHTAKVPGNHPNRGSYAGGGHGARGPHFRLRAGVCWTPPIKLKHKNKVGLDSELQENQDQDMHCI